MLPELIDLKHGCRWHHGDAAQLPDGRRGVSAEEVCQTQEEGKR